jgi:hypothetical protein
LNDEGRNKFWPQVFNFEQRHSPVPGKICGGSPKLENRTMLHLVRVDRTSGPEITAVTTAVFDRARGSLSTRIGDNDDVRQTSALTILRHVDQGERDPTRFAHIASRELIAEKGRTPDVGIASSDRKAPLRPRFAILWPVLMVGVGFAATIAWTVTLGWFVLHIARSIL